MSVKDSNLVPNNWEVRGDVDLQGQRDWYEAMFEACRARLASWNGILVMECKALSGAEHIEGGL